MNKKSRQLAKNTLIIAISKLFTSFFGFLLLPLYTRFLSTSEYGAYDLIVTYGALFAPIIIMRIEIALFRWLVDARDDKERMKLIISSIIGLVFFVLLGFSCVFMAISLLVHIPYSQSILIYIISLVISSLILQITRGVGKITDYAISSVLSGLVTIALSILFVVVLKMGVGGILLGMSIGNLLGAIYAFIRIKIYKYIVASCEETKLIRKQMLKFSLPMIPNSLSWWVVNVSDRTIIASVIGLAANGIYAVSNKFSGLASSVYSIFDLSWAESASLHINAPDRDQFFSSVLDNVARVFGSMCILLITVVPLLFGLSVGDLYHEAYLYIPILMIGMYANIMVRAMGGIYLANKMSRKVMDTTIFAAIINLVVDLLLIWFIGIWAAAVSTAIAYGSMAIYRHYDIRKIIKITYEKGIFIKITSIFIIVSALYYVNNIWFNIINIILGTAVSLAINRKVINIGIKYVQQRFSSNNK